MENLVAIGPLVEQIKTAIFQSINPDATKVEREQAYKVLEKVKESEDQCTDDALFFIYAKENGCDVMIRACALQLLEQYIRCSSVTEKKFHIIKERFIAAIKIATFEEETFLKEALVKAIVELVKRSWPQKWSSLLQDLSNLQQNGPAQLELVLLVLMRFCEDIHLDEHLAVKRRRELLSTLNDNMKSLFEFFLTTLHNTATRLKDNTATKLSVRLAEASLFTLTAFVSWVKFNNLFANNKVLFRTLFQLLEFDSLKYHACTCLEVIFERKGTVDQRLEIVNMIDNEVLQRVQDAAVKSNSTAQDDLEEYQFLKKLVSTMSLFGQKQLCGLTADNKKKMRNFSEYLKLMLGFACHDSMIICLTVSRLWQCLLNNEYLRKQTEFVEVLPDIMRYAFKNISKIGDPRLDTAAGDYSKIDFNDTEEFHDTYGDLRCVQLDVTRLSIQNKPPLGLLLFETIVVQAVSTPPPSVDDLSMEKQMLTTHYIEWDALAQFAKNGFSNTYFRIRKTLDEVTINTFNGILQRVLEYDAKSPMFVMQQAAVVEALFPLFKHSQTHLMTTLTMLCRILDVDSTNSETMSKMKRAVCCIYVTMCKEVGHLLAPFFEEMQSYFGKQFSQSSLNSHEKSLLLEGLLLVCAHLENNDLKKQFIENIFAASQQCLGKDQTKLLLEDTSTFAKFLGLDTTTPSLPENVLAEHKEFMMSLAILQAISRTLAVCTEKTVAHNISDEKINEHTVRYIWVQPMVNCLPHLFNLAKRICELWKLKLSVERAEALNLCPAEYHAQPRIDRENANHSIQLYLFNLQETLYTTLSHLGTCIGPVLYVLPDIGAALSQTFAHNWTLLPNYRLRKVWKSFMKRFVICCPERFYPAIGPFLQECFQNMLQRLSKEWENRSIEEEQNAEDKNNESAEVVELRMLSMLTKDYIETIVSFLMHGKKCEATPCNGSLDNFGNLADFLLSYEGTNLLVVYTIFTSLSWPDSSNLHKICAILMIIVKKLFVRERLVNAEIPNQLFLLLLKSFRQHGADVSLGTALFNVIYHFYIYMRMQYPELVNVMMIIPSCPSHLLQEYDLKTFNGDKINETKNKAIFKNLVSGAKGENVSRAHLDTNFYSDLPSLAPRIKKQNTSLLESDDTGVCKLFADV